VRGTAAPARSTRVSPLVWWGSFFFRYRNGLFPLVLVALFAGFRPVYPGGSERLDTWLDLLGIGVILTGQSLRAAVIGYAYIQRGGKNKQVHAETLVTEGLFRHSRNPLYLGNLLVLTGLFIVHHNPWVYGLGIPFFVFAYRSIVAAEEAYLRGKFGAKYEEYCRRVNRWLPDFRGLRRSIEGMRFSWRRVVLKEYGSTCAWCAGVLLLLAYDTLTHFHYEQRPLYLTTLAALLAVVAAAWVTVRFLKKSRRLVEEGPQGRATPRSG
jgi:protein-S-isoprenylcysteine O-methyltransferase Ste14